MSLNPISKAILICFFGFLLSLSAPGYDLWFLAWFCLSPLFIIIYTSKKTKEAILYSLLFGFSYNAWYLHWLFSLHPLNWLGFSNVTSFLFSVFALITVAFYNSLFFALYTFLVLNLKRISSSPFDKDILSIILSTLIWLVVFNKLSSCKLLFGFPWTLVEYSQYKNLFLIQIAIGILFA